MSDEIEGLNPGIVRTVAILRAAGFDTCDSGDGETHEFACDRDYPYVVAVVEPALLVQETDRLRTLLEARGLRCVPIEGGDWAPGTFSVQGSYNPPNGATVDVMGVADKDLPTNGAN